MSNKLNAKLEAVKELLEWSKNAERNVLKKRKKKPDPEEDVSDAKEDKGDNEASE